MKPLAILKDSLREAWDSKTLLVMLVLAGIFLIGVASIGYSPAEPRKVFDEQFEKLSAPVLRINRGKFQAPLLGKNNQPVPHPVYQVTTFRTTKDGSHPSLGEHEFTIVVKSSEEFNADSAGDRKEKKDGNVLDLPPTDTFEKIVAAWHETPGAGNKPKYIAVPEGDRTIVDPRQWVLLQPVTDEMIRDYFEVEIERDTQVALKTFEKLPPEKPGERVYKFTTAPSTEPRVWPVRFSILFGAWESDEPLPLGLLLYTIQDLLISSVGGLMIILIAVIVTSFFIPNMLRPGSVVMLLSKPISRTTLLLFKYFGGLFFVLILTTFTVGGVWLITGIRAGVWAPGVFAVVPLMTLSFAILYAVSTATAVLTRNSIVAILVTLMFAGFLWLVGKVEFIASVHRMTRDAVAELKGEKAEYAQWATISGGLNSALPRWHDIDVLTGDVVSSSLMTTKQQESQQGAMKKHLPTWGGTLGVTALWIAGLLGFSCWWFSRKDF